MILNVKSIGLNSDKLEDTLRAIDNNIKQEINNTKLKNFNPVEIGNFCFAINEATYLKGIQALKNFQENIVKIYNDYFSIVNNCNLIKNNLNNKKELNIQELTSYIYALKKSLALLKNSSTIDYGMEKNIAEMVYKITYEIIKKEIKIKNSTELLEYVKSSEIDSNYLDSIIRKEIENLNLNDNKNLLIKIKVDEINSKGLESSFVDSELIDLLCNQKSNIKIEEKYQQLEIMYNNLLTLNKKINNLFQDTTQYKYDIDGYHLDFKNLKRDILKNIMSISLTLSILGLTGFGVNKFLIKHSTINYYNTNEYCYSTLTNNYSEKENIVLPKEDNNMIYIIKYKPWVMHRNYERKVITYKISNLDYQVLKDYLNLDMEKLGIEGTVTTEYKDSLLPEDLYTSEYCEVFKYNQDNQIIKSEVDNINIAFGNLLFGIFILFIIFLIEDVKEYYDTDTISRIKNILEDLKMTKEEKKNIKININNYNESYNELKKLIKENDKLKNDFIEFYKKYRKYFNDSKDIDEMNQKIESLKYLVNSENDLEIKLNRKK